VRGSIVKRRWKRSVSWSVVLDAGADPVSGRRRQRWTTCRTRREADFFLAQALAHGVGMPSPRMRFGDLADYWLGTVQSRIRPSTLSVYRYALRQHLVPHLGDVPLLKLTAPIIERWIDTMHSCGLSPSTVHQAYRVLRSILRQAVLWGMLSRSPLATVRPPRLPRRDPQVWDEEQLRLFLAEAKRSSRYATLYLAAILTGAREGELLALTWDRIDWMFGRGSITHTLARSRGRVELREPKSRRSQRTVPLPPVLIEALQRERDAQARHRVLHGPAYENRNLVFCQANGKPLHAHNITQRDFRRIAEQLGLPHIRFHDLRHSCATMLLRQGVHPKVVAELLGHASIGVTLDTYSHVVPALMEEAASLLAARLVGGGTAR